MFAHFHHVSYGRSAFYFLRHNYLFIFGSTEEWKKGVSIILFVSTCKRHQTQGKVQELCMNRIMLNAYKIEIILHDRNVYRPRRAFLSLLRRFLLLGIVDCCVFSKQHGAQPLKPSSGNVWESRTRGWKQSDTHIYFSLLPQCVCKYLSVCSPATSYTINNSSNGLWFWSSLSHSLSLSFTPKLPLQLQFQFRFHLILLRFYLSLCHGREHIHFSFINCLFMVFIFCV